MLLDMCIPHKDTPHPGREWNVLIASFAKWGSLGSKHAPIAGSLMPYKAYKDIFICTYNSIIGHSH